MKPAMSKVKRIEGVLSPVITPFKKDYAPDEERFVRHCRWLLKRGVSPATLMPGTGHCALTDSIELTRAAVELGCAGVLMLPPFYYKGVSDEGLYRNFAEVIERVGDERLQLYLYHIPPVSQVPITLGLIERLLSKYPGIVAGVKDSSGDWPNTKAMLDAFAKEGFDVFAGSEVFLLDNMRHGGKGCITATGNVNPGAIDRLYKNWRSPDADQLQAGISATRKIVQKQPMIPALKTIVAHFGNDAGWKRCRPPLVELSASQEEELIRDLKGVGFTMPGLAA